MRRLILTIGLALIVLLVGAASSPAFAQTVKVGVFDPQQVSENTDMGKSVMAQLSAFRDKKQAEIDEKEKSIGALQQELSQKQLSLSQDKRSTMERDIQRQLLDLQSARESASRELQLELGASKDSFEQKLLAAVEAFGKDSGFTVLLDSSLVAWASSSIDVTTAIVDRFNLMFPVEEN